MPTPPLPTPPSGGPAAGTPTTDSNGNPVLQITGANGNVTVSIVSSVQASAEVPGTATSKMVQGSPVENSSGGIIKSVPRMVSQSVSKTVQQVIQEAGSWTVTQKDQFATLAKSAGIITTAHPSFAELAQAWSLVVQEAVLQGKNPDDLIKVAAKGGWQSIGPNIQPSDAGLTGTGDQPINSTTNSQGQTTTDTGSTLATTSHTSYISYMDPATVVGAYNDAYYRLDGRLPSQAQQQAFLNQVYQYEDQANTGRFESGIILKEGQKIDQTSGQVVDSKTGQPVPESNIQRVGNNDIQSSGSTTTNQSIVSQRSIGQRGLELLAGESAMSDPEEGAYQARTTYLNAMIKALGGVAEGMQQSGPTTTAP